MTLPELSNHNKCNPETSIVNDRSEQEPNNNRVQFPQASTEASVASLELIAGTSIKISTEDAEIWGKVDISDGNVPGGLLGQTNVRKWVLSAVLRALCVRAVLGGQKRSCSPLQRLAVSVQPYHDRTTFARTCSSQCGGHGDVGNEAGLENDCDASEQCGVQAKAFLSGYLAYSRAQDDSLGVRLRKDGVDGRQRRDIGQNRGKEASQNHSEVWLRGCQISGMFAIFAHLCHYTRFC